MTLLVARTERPTLKLMGTILFFAGYAVLMVVATIFARRTFARR